ncbi:MAG: M24 family metallopeptidase [Phycisphaerae bacterium]
MNLDAVQTYLRDQKIDAWLIYDFRGSNAVLSQLLSGIKPSTRRAMLLIPAGGEPTLLLHPLDRHQFPEGPVRREFYAGWVDLRDWLAKRLSGMARVAMEYSPGAALPVVGIVDAGTVELIRSLGVDVCSSANLIQVGVARWSANALEKHLVASKRVAEAKDSAFDLIRKSLAANRTLLETDVQRHILDRFSAAGLQWPDDPIVAVNAHAGDPHYEPSAKTPTPIRRDDWVLIDLWARIPGDENIYSDITWVGYAGASVSAEHRRVFEIVKAARDAAVERARQAWQRKERLEGWQLDEAARAVIIHAGFGHAIKHRTGHSLSPGPKVHGLGVNLDNLETHDTREVLAGIGYTVEPGIYLPEFGVRLEINVFTDPKDGPRVTSCVQDEIVMLG